VATIPRTCEGSELTVPEVVELARHANANVTLTVYVGLVGGDRTAAMAKLAAAGFGT
jgi:hypothetical protein